MTTSEDDKRYGLKPLPDVPFIGAEESQRRRADYEASRARHLMLHPPVETLEPFVITPELEQERADRIDNQWKKKP